MGGGGRALPRGVGPFDAYLASDAPLARSCERIFQGAIADALTHVGQLALLRRLAGEPVRGENYSVADIATGRVGAAQTDGRREFDREGATGPIVFPNERRPGGDAG